MNFREMLLSNQSIVVVDIGKTLSKVTLWTSDGRLVDRQTRPNDIVTVRDVRRLDVEGIGDWLLNALSRYTGADVGKIVPVGHGAGVAAIDGDKLAFLPLDYEQPIPDAVMAAYRAVRDPFSGTGSPALPQGLNIGSQLYWLEHLYPEEMQRAMFLPWAQYWAWFLSGKAVSEVTSLGCHSDLWLPGEKRYSDMADHFGWAGRFAPLARADDVVGRLRPDIATVTGLPGTVEVLAGLHDSNAALLAARGFEEIGGQEATVLSTGTWFISMRLPEEEVSLATLADGRDCLVNVDAYGQPVPSARFMGGREIETVIEIDTRRVDIKPDQPALLAAVDNIVARGTMLLPTLAPGCGPFPNAEGRWINPSDNWYERRAAACLYAALMTETALALIGSKGRLLVEGRFAEAEVFVRALASLRPDMEVYRANAHNDVSFGALRLIDPGLQPQGELERILPLDADISAYRAEWRAALGEHA